MLLCKKYNIVLMLMMVVLTIYISYGQPPSTLCVDPPSFELEGIDVALKYYITDETIDQSACEGTYAPYIKDFGRMELPPYEYDDKTLLVLRTGRESGTKLVCLGSDHEIIWENHVNMLNNYQGRPYNVVNVELNEDGLLEVMNVSGLNYWDGKNYRSIQEFGHHGMKLLNPDTGEEIESHWAGETINLEGLGTLESFPYATRAFNNGRYNYLEEENAYQFSLIRGYTSGDTSALVENVKLDANTFVKKNPIGVYEPLLQNIGEDIIAYYDGLSGPYFHEDSTFYFYSTNRDTMTNLEMVYIDESGNLLLNKDITSEYNPDGEYRINTTSKVLEYEDRLLFSYKQNKQIGYVVLDKHGKAIRRRHPLNFDGHDSEIAQVIYLEEDQSYLHFISNLSERKIYVYEEYEDGTYRKAGEMSADPDYDYAYYVKSAHRLENGDFILQIKSQYNYTDSFFGEFAYGGWASIFRIGAEEFGLTSSTAEVVSSASIYPNPTHGLLHFKDLKMVGSRIEICNMYGQVIISDQLDATLRIDIGDQISGMYIVRIIDDTGKLIGIEKVIKG